MIPESGCVVSQPARVAHFVHRLQGVTEPDQLACSLVEALVEAFHADVAALYLLHEDGQLVPAASRGLLPEEEAEVARVASGGHPAWVARSRRTLLCGDSTQDPRVLPVGHGLRCQSIMCTPLLAPGDYLVGAVEVASRAPYAFNAGDAADLEAIATHAALSVGSAARTVAAEQRAVRLERISVANQAIAAASGLPEVIERSARLATELFGIAGASVIALGVDGRIELGAHHGAMAATGPLTAGQARALLRQPGYHAISETTEMADTGDLHLRLVAEGVHSLLVVPIVRGARPLGLLVLAAGMGNPPFDSELEQGASIVAGQIAVAIENARLYGQILAAQQRTEAVIQLTTTGILVVDDAGTIRHANRAAGDIRRTWAEDLPGRHIDDALGTAVWESLCAAAAGAKGSRPPLERRLRAEKVDIQTDVLLDIARLRDGYVVSMTDVTRLKEVDRLKTQLVANVSHELRSPLASIKAYAELLSEGLDEGDPALRERFLAVITQQADRVEQTVTNLLDLSRVEAEGYRLRLERCSLAQIIADAIDAVTVRAMERQVEMKVDPAPPDVTLLADRGLLLTMLRNLIDNAVKFSPERSRVLVGARRTRRCLAISVRDFGIGIPKSEQSLLFNKFVRLPSATRISAEGTGLGLVIAQQIARAHGGDIRVHSAVNEGSVFTVLLPDRLIAGGEAAPTGAAPALKGGKRVHVG